jgi:hypothetical protein
MIVCKIFCKILYLSSCCDVQFSKFVSAASKSLNNEETLVLKFLGKIHKISAFAISYSVHQMEDNTVSSVKLFNIQDIS